MTYATDIDQLVLFAHKQAHSVSASLRASNWAEENITQWGDDGPIMLVELLMEDIPPFQLQARMSAISSTVQHLHAQHNLYDVFFDKGVDGTTKKEDVWNTLVAMITFEGFKRNVFQEEEKIVALFEYASDTAARDTLTDTTSPTSLNKRGSYGPR